MPVLGASFQIGRSALAAYQSAIAITGQNLANIGNPNYTRQSGHLSALYGGMTPAGVTPGTGVEMDKLQRHIDEAIEEQLRVAIGQRNGAESRYQTLAAVEGLYGELSDYDLSTQLNDLFGAFTNLQTDPTEITARDTVIANAAAVATSLQRQRSGLVDQVDNLNDLTRTTASEASKLAEEIADLNERIVAASARGSGGDSALKDRRDALLRNLAELVDIRTQQQDHGVMNVYLGSEPLVEYGAARALTTADRLVAGIVRSEVRFADSGSVVSMDEGRLAQIVDVRDNQIVAHVDKLDQLARGLIYEVNRVHSSGRGLDDYSTITSTFAVDDPDAALGSSAAGLPFPVQNGVLMVHVNDRVGSRGDTHMIEIDLDGLRGAAGADMSLNDLAAALDAIAGVNASVNAANQLEITTDAAHDISFSGDTSGVLAALGMGTFFSGSSAADIRVSSTIRNNPRLIATSISGAVGDGANAGKLAQVSQKASTLLNNLGVQEFHEEMIHGLAVETAAAQAAFDASDAVYSSLLAQRESISGVSPDEEAINLTMYERAFQGASRYLTVLDTVSESILGLVR